jgi:adenosine deaminase
VEIDIDPRIVSAPKIELHQHTDGSIPVEVTWELMRHHGLHPVDTIEEMRRRLEIQEHEEGTLMSYLDKMHYPMWITQFYENIASVTEAIVDDAAKSGVRTLELRYSPIIHTFAGLTPRQAIRAVLSGMNHANKRHGMKLGLIVIAMRQHGPHIAKILARSAISEAQHLHARTGVVGFDIAGPESGNPPHLFASSYEIARLGRLGLTAHAGEDGPPRYIWEAIDGLGCQRIGHGCSAVQDPALLKRLAKDKILVECCISSNQHTGAVKKGAPHPIRTMLEYGIPVSICCDNSTVSRTNQNIECFKAAEEIGVDALLQILKDSEAHTFIKPETALVEPGID